MIRRLPSIALIACTTMILTVAQAAPLYKWVEPDGSITFSPKQPPAGIQYETVNKGVQAASQLSGATKAAPAAPAAIRATAPATVSAINSGAHNASTPKVIYAPGQTNTPLAANNAPQTNRRSTGQNISSNGLIRTPATENSNATQAQQAVATSHKQRRCQDLRKRVVSLERRLKTRLTPQDMDNTVIHMARYQRSFDQHCVQ